MQAYSTKNPIKKPYFISAIVVRKKCGSQTKGILAAGLCRFQCAIGRSGITARKREGDGATPLANMRFLSGFQKNSLRKLPQTVLKLKRVKRNDGWCDSVGDRNYNRPVRLPYQASAEKLLRDDHLYDIALIPDWNIRQRIQNRGSAIFVHLARPAYAPTEGCIALSRRDMERLLPHISRKTRLIIQR